GARSVCDRAARLDVDAAVQLGILRAAGHEDAREGRGDAGCVCRRDRCRADVPAAARQSCRPAARTGRDRARSGRRRMVRVVRPAALAQIGLLASTSTRLYNSAFFALQDTKTPAKVAAMRVVFAAGIGAGLMFLLQRVSLAGQPLGPVGIALGAGAGAWFEWFALRRSL